MIFQETVSDQRVITIESHNTTGFYVDGHYNHGPHLVTNKALFPITREEDLVFYSREIKKTFFFIGSEVQLEFGVLRDYTIWAFQRECSFEWMSYTAACGLINILQLEKRPFVALLVPLESSNFIKTTILNSLYYHNDNF